MTKLKTLKDLDCKRDLPTFEGKNKLSVFVWETGLRKEAIKWIKSNEIAIDVKHSIYEGVTCDKIKAVQSAWIKHFFNITEDDLKDYVLGADFGKEKDYSLINGKRI